MRVPAGNTWPPPPGADVVVVAEAMTAVEKRALRAWLRTNAPDPAHVRVVHLPADGSARGPGSAELAQAMAASDDPYLLPVGVVWEPLTERRRVRLRDVLVLGDPRRPRPPIQPLIERAGTYTCTVVAGAGARLSELRARLSAELPSDGDTDVALTALIATQATVAIESAISRRIGPQYKIPRLMRHEIAASGRFDGLVRDLAQRLNRPADAVRDEAEAALDEMVTGWSRLLVDVQAKFGRSIYKRGYDDRIEYDAAQTARVRSAIATHPAVLLMSHRSHLDGLVLPVAMLENEMPRTHLLGGANMAVWPIGSLFRRAGVIFIRREFRDDQVYKAVLREYVGHLVEKRFHLQWAIEGTRSRTGKMEPPKLGLLAYVVDAYRKGRTEDVLLVPVSIAYDQLHEVREFAAYAGGTEKKPENLGYIVDYIRSQRQDFGKIYVNFAEPISVREQLARAGEQHDPNELHKLAFEVSWRMNHVTPITGAALATTVLLAAQGRALTLDQIRGPLADMLDYADRRHLPLASSAHTLRSDSGVVDMLGALTRNHVVQHFSEGQQPVWRVARNQHLAASFYRNSLIHHYLDRGIAELALLRAARADPDDALQAFWDEAFTLRDLLKFDFFFPEREEFIASVTADLAAENPEWQEQIKAGGSGARALLESLRPLTAHFILRSFLEAYEVVAQVLLDEPARVDEKQLRKHALAVGRQYLMQRRVSSPESVSALLFRTGVQLVAHEGLLVPGDDLAARRAGLAEQLRDLHARADEIERIAQARQEA